MARQKEVKTCPGKEYLEKYRSRLLLAGLMAFLLHGAKLDSGIIGIDTEDLLRLGEDFYGGWLHTGRQGLVFLKYLLGNAGFPPYFSGLMTVLLFPAAVAAFLALWDRCGGRQAGMAAWAFGSLLWISHPAMVEQFYFSLQSMEICLALLLTALALYLSSQWVEGRSGWCAVGSVAVLLLTFSVYQSLVAAYIFGTTAMLLLQALKEAAEGKDVGTLGDFGRVSRHCVLFLAAFLLNTLVTRLFFASSGYLENQIFWGRASVKDCLHAIVGHVLRVCTGYDSIFYSAGFGALALLDLGLLLWFLAGKKGRGQMGRILFFYAALLATPFLMTLLLGGAPAMRSQLVLPAATGFLAYFGMLLAQMGWGRAGRGRVLFGCGAALCLATGIGQTKVTGSLYYTDRCRYEQDAALGRALIARIEQVSPGGERLPVAAIGGREFSGNQACVAGEIIGRSFFNYDREVEPRFYWSTRRMLGFLNTLGADYPLAPEAWVETAAAYSASMPEWPAQGSVQVRDGMVIVKFSSD